MTSARTPSGKRRPERKLITRWFLAGGAVVIVVVVLAAIALGRSNGNATSNAAATGASSGARINTAIPVLNATSLNGTSVAIPTNKPTAVYFFAGWCGTCVPEAVTLNKLDREYGNAVSIVGIDVDPSDSKQTIEKFLQAAGHPQFQVVHDTDGAIARAFNVTSLDVTVMAGSNGTVVYRGSSPMQEAQLRTEFAKVGLA